MFNDIEDKADAAIKNVQETILKNPFIPHKPTNRQFVALAMVDTRELLYGGAAGGGKSDWLLMEGLRYVDQPQYRGIILRRTYQDLALPGALMDRAHEWLGPTRAVYIEKRKVWVFPSGATLSFGYMESENDKYRYQGSEFHFIGFDESTQMTGTQYLYLLSRLRSNLNDPIPLRMRAASNPGNVGHQFFYDRFVREENRTKGAVYVPARLEDNPYINATSYNEMLEELDPLERQRLRWGNWEARPDGNMIDPSKFIIVAHVDVPVVGRVRFWDMAASEVSEKNPDPDFTVGALMSMDRKRNRYLEHINRFRKNPEDVEKAIRSQAITDGIEVSIAIEQEPGSAGKHVINHYQRNVLPEFHVIGIPSTRNKVLRSNSWRAAVGNEMFHVVSGAWNRPFFDECATWTGDGDSGHDDQIDAVSGANQALTEKLGIKTGGVFSGLNVRPAAR